MPKLISVTFSCLLLSLSAHADTIAGKWTCSPYPPTPAGEKDAVQKIEVSLQSGSWAIVHITKSGKQYDRAKQYSIIDTSTTTPYLSWQGRLVGHQNLMMKGDIVNTNAGIIYS